MVYDVREKEAERQLGGCQSGSNEELKRASTVTGQWKEQGDYTMSQNWSF